MCVCVCVCQKTGTQGEIPYACQKCTAYHFFVCVCVWLKPNPFQTTSLSLSDLATHENKKEDKATQNALALYRALAHAHFSRLLMIGKHCHIQLIVLIEFVFRIWSKHIMVKIARINIEFIGGHLFVRFFSVLWPVEKFNGFIVGRGNIVIRRAESENKTLLEIYWPLKSLWIIRWAFGIWCFQLFNECLNFHSKYEQPKRLNFSSS